MPFLLVGIASLGWAGFSLFTGKGYYKGCPPGGFDRDEHPVNFWIPTLIILGIGIFMILIFLGWIPLPSRGIHGGALGAMAFPSDELQPIERKSREGTC